MRVRSAGEQVDRAFNAVYLMSHRVTMKTFEYSGRARGSLRGYRRDSWHFLLPICRIYADFKGHFSSKECQ
jgi:hypothetical protein